MKLTPTEFCEVLLKKFTPVVGVITQSKVVGVFVATDVKMIDCPSQIVAVGTIIEAVGDWAKTQPLIIKKVIESNFLITS